MKKLLSLFQGCLLLFVLSCSKEAGTEAPSGQKPESSLSLVKAFPNLLFNRPLDLQSPGDGSNRLFVAEQGGRILQFQNDSTVLTATPFLDISAQTDTSGSELGLLGFTFHPDFINSGYFYVYYTPSSSESLISRFQVNPNDPAQANPDSETILLRIAQPFANHNGGQLAFGPDGFLYIASGDGGGAGDPFNNGQDLDSYLGKILRIDVNRTQDGKFYGIPPENPYSDQAGPAQTLYAYGLRNPWRMSFDGQTGNLWVGDVGQNAREEVNNIVKGGNYGWNIMEGDDCFQSQGCDTSGLLPPVYEYDHQEGDQSITGGGVYRGSSVPQLQGEYLFADFISGRIWALDVSQPNPSARLLMATGLNIASFGTDAALEVYLCSFDGSIYRFMQE